MEAIIFEVELPAGLEPMHLPAGVNRRLQRLLDRQDAGKPLTPAEREEAQGLVDLAEWLSFVRLRTQRVSREAAQQP